MSISERLRDERGRLSMTQEAFGAVAGVRKQAQHMYESGARKPDSAYLAAIAAAGADVLYILTGRRAPVAAAAPEGSAGEAPSDYTLRSAVTTRERALLDNYRAAGEDGRRVIEGAATLAAQSASRARRVKRGGKAA